ncbi:RNA-binding protein [Carboxylicivirga sp. M1479]|uniref:RNA recognition motif domain-containing protein n=1 Tax=Carboxylicivirga sp. M1479 TaxID=2594476 RepID=UPI001178A7E8|nr:RNA-binding protein [Carboxylicivirga sp. M1479]TRX65831.1 RNA-binding protein [Carboxylicivirga sp. M1479]
MNIFIAGLTDNIYDEDLQDLFEEYGEVTSAKVIKDRETRKSRGFGFVEMSDDAAAKKAIKELDRAEYDGKIINIKEARPKEGGNGGRQGGGNRGGNRRR